MTGILIGEQTAWGCGYGSDAVRLRTAYAFEELGLERLESVSLADNIGMHRVLQRAGYSHIATARHSLFRGGRWHDTHVFELLREDWKP